MPKLVIESGTDAGAIFALDKPVMSIGRSVSNNIQVVDRRMSRNHVELLVEGNRLVLRDLGSKNGTLLNGAVARELSELKHHDRIQIGDTVMRIDLDPDADSSGGEGGATSGVREGLRSRYKLVEEKQWGATRGERRAGYNPEESDSLTNTSFLDLKQPNRRLEILYQVTDAIRSIFSLDELLDRIMTIIQTVVRPDRTYLLLVDAETGELQPRVVKVMMGENPTEVKISSTIVNRCVRDVISLLVSNAALDERFNASESIVSNAIRTAMVAPLIFKSASIGVIYVDTQSRMASFSEEELELLTSIANQAAVAITNARLQSQLVEQHKLAREMEIARDIQMNLLPKTYPDLPGYQLSAMSLPAKHVGGDYYDFLRMPDGRLGLAVADVSGKGVPAAILTAATRSYLQGGTQVREPSLVHLVQRINRNVHRDVSNDMYVTMAFILLDESTGAIEYVNAGHAQPIVLLPSGEMEFLDAGGLFLGIDEEADYEAGISSIPPGGVLLLYTDGVTDILSPDGQSFTLERFQELIKDKRHLSAEEIRNAVYQACLRHRASADQFDDFTLIVLKRLDFNDSEMD